MSDLDPRLLPLIDALAELAVEDYLRSEAARDVGIAEASTKRPPLPDRQEAA